MNHTRECFAAHMGLYCCEPLWMRQAVSAIQAGRIPTPRAASAGQSSGLFQIGADGIAVIPIKGPMFKGQSKFSEANTLRLRQAMREAAQSQDVKGILLFIDSPGGTVAGTADLASEVSSAVAVKPVHAYIEDLGASAAYWVASQAGRISANSTAEIGSIGTVAVVEDTSGRAAVDGVVVHVVSTGRYKGAFADGAPVLPEHLADLQQRVDALNGHFLEAIQRGRWLKPEKAQALADGRLHIAASAQALKLIDAVGTLEDAAAELRADIELRAAKQTSRRRRAAALIALTELGGTQ